MTRWTLLKWKLIECRDAICMYVAWRMPKRVAMWCAIRIGAHATTGKHERQEVPALLFMDAMKRWDVQ